MRHSSHVERPDDREPETQEERAIRSLQAIFSGGDLTAETTQLANEFTDRQSGRLTGWLRRKRGGTE
jgi:hypothetical protein